MNYVKPARSPLSNDILLDFLVELFRHSDHRKHHLQKHNSDHGTQDLREFTSHLFTSKRSLQYVGSELHQIIHG